MKMLQNIVAAVLALCLGGPGGILAAEFSITVTPERFPAGANINITMAADKLQQRPTSFTLMLKRNKLADSPLFTARADGCRVFKVNIESIQCDFEQAKFKIQIRNLYHKSDSEVYMKVGGPDTEQSKPVSLDFFVSRRRDQEFLEMEKAMENFKKATIGLRILLTGAILGFCVFLYYLCPQRKKK